MCIEELYDDLMGNDAVVKQISGEITLDFTGSIRYQYDALLKDYDMSEEHFSEIYESNKEIISEYLNDNGVEDEYLITEYEIEDTILIFYITN